MSKQKIISLLKELTNHDYVEVVTRGNSAITSALSIINTQVLIPEEGGWIHYQTAPKTLGLETVEVKCNDAKIDLKDLEHKSKKQTLFFTRRQSLLYKRLPPFCIIALAVILPNNL